MVDDFRAGNLPQTKGEHSHNASRIVYRTVYTLSSFIRQHSTQRAVLHCLSFSTLFFLHFFPRQIDFFPSSEKFLIKIACKLFIDP